MINPQIQTSHIQTFADEKVNLKEDSVKEYREQVNSLKQKLENHIQENPDFGLVKMLNSGSLAKGTALKTINDIDVVYADITHPKIKKHGIVVVKVFIPKLQPLYLDEHYPYLGGNRLYEVPVQLGFLKVPNQEFQLNKIPHPFL